jgi:hypothetical protein
MRTTHCSKKWTDTAVPALMNNNISQIKPAFDGSHERLSEIEAITEGIEAHQLLNEL